MSETGLLTTETPSDSPIVASVSPEPKVELTPITELRASGNTLCPNGHQFPLGFYQNELPFCHRPNGYKINQRSDGSSPKNQFSFQGIYCMQDGIQYGSADLTAEDVLKIAKNIPLGKIVLIMPEFYGGNFLGDRKADVLRGSWRHEVSYLLDHAVTAIFPGRIFRVIEEHHWQHNPREAESWCRAYPGKLFDEKFTLRSGHKFPWISRDDLRTLVAEVQALED